MKQLRHPRWAALGLALILVLAACGSDDSNDSGGDNKSGNKPQAAIGKGEGAISILAWPGYAEDGSTSKDLNWVGPFEKQTGCKASIKTFGTSDEAFQLFSTGEYDVVSASGDSSLRSVANGDVAPLNTSLLTAYPDIAPFLKGQKWNSVADVVYGLPHGWGANYLMWNANVVTPAPTSWGVVFAKDSPYKGKITGYDAPIYIADAALYLSKTQPDLGITNAYALDQNQFDAAVALMKQQKPNIGEYWSDYLKEQEAFTKGSIVLGTSWQITTNGVEADPESPPVQAIIPTEGATAWSDNWMVKSNAKHPNCAYLWLNWITKPDVLADVVEYFGEAPANLEACKQTTDPDHCANYHADDQVFYNQLAYWTTPTKLCQDGRTDVECVPYKEWSSAWDEIKGS